MSLLYSSNFRYPEGDHLRKNQELFIDASPHYNQQQQQQNNNQQHQQNNSGLMRHRSAPSSVFDSLVNGSSSGGGGGGDYQYFRSSSPEIDTFLAKYMLPSNNSGDLGSHDLQQFGEKSMKQEEAETNTNTTTTTTTTNVPPQNGYSNGSSSHMIYQSLQVQDLQGNYDNNNNNNTMDASFGVTNSMILETKMATGNGSNLIRQSSSPAGVFSNLGVDNGFAVMRDVGCFRGGNGTNGEAGASTSRLNNHINFSTGPSSRLNMPQTDGNMYFGLNTLETQNGNAGSRSNGLTHHLSLPKTSSEMAAVEKFLHFQGSIPCKIRAKRGCATHPRSIAERVRRTRISERMRKLQDLFPNIDKQANTADMLDMAVEYIKILQKEVKTLTDTKAKCTCSHKQKQL